MPFDSALLEPARKGFDPNLLEPATDSFEDQLKRGESLSPESAESISPIPAGSAVDPKRPRPEDAATFEEAGGVPASSPEVLAARNEAFRRKMGMPGGAKVPGVWDPSIPLGTAKADDSIVDAISYSLAETFLPGVDKNKIAPYVAASINNVKGMVEFVESPGGLALTVASMGNPILARLIAAGFMGKTAAELPASVNRAREAHKSGTDQEKADATVGLVSEILLTGAMGKHAFSKLPKSAFDLKSEAEAKDKALQATMPATIPAVTEATLDRLESESKSPETKIVTTASENAKAAEAPAVAAAVEAVKEETPKPVEAKPAEAKPAETPPRPGNGDLFDQGDNWLGYHDYEKGSESDIWRIVTKEGESKIIQTSGTGPFKVMDGRKVVGSFDKWNDAKQKAIDIVKANESEPTPPPIAAEGKEKQSKEFDDLIRKHGAELGWVDPKHMDIWGVEIGKASDTASIKGKLAQNNALKQARRNAALELGEDVSSVDSIAGRAALLEKLKARVSERQEPDAKHDQPGDNTEFLPPQPKVTDFTNKDWVDETGKDDLKLVGEEVKDTAKEEADKTRKAEEKAESEKRQMGFEGMGAAVPSEFEGNKDYVSNMFAAIDRDRLAMGKPVMEPTVRRTWDEDNQRALAQMNRDPSWIPNLIQAVLKSPRPLLSWENAGVVWHRARLKAEYNNALQRIASAFDDGREADLTSAKTDAAVFEDQLEELDRAVGRNGTGSEAGRSLQAQKMGAGDDFTLIEMTLQKRAALGGRRLTPEETAEIQSKLNELNKANEELAKHLSERDLKISELETSKAIAELQASNAPRFDKRILAAAEKIVTRMETAGEAAEKRLLARLGRTSAGVDPSVVPDAAIWLSAKVARMGLDLAKATDLMIEKFGEGFRTLMPQIWAAANRIIDSNTEGEPAAVRRVVRKADVPAAREAAAKDVRAKSDRGEINKIARTVQQLARTFVENGITDREQLIDAVHEVLKEAVPEFTRRQTMDAISGYGDFKQLSKDEITIQLRGMKGEMQQLAKLEDMAKGQPPLKTGLERRTPTEVERKLIKRVNEAKNKFQVPMSDPATQLKSSLDTLKTALTNRIKDYEERLANKDYSTRKRQEIKLDETANRLKERADRIKIQFRDELLKDRLKNRPTWEKALDWTTKIRRFDVLSSPVVIPKLLSAGAQRLAAFLPEELAGGIIGKIPGYRDVFSKAPLEGGGPNLKGEMRGFSNAFTKGMKDAWDVLKTGRSELDVLYGKAGESYTGEYELASKILAMPGRIHGMIKAPIKRATFERAIQRYGEFYAKQGIDVGNEVVRTRIMVDAYKAANRSIFLDDNRIASGFSAMLRRWEAANPATGKPPVGGKVASTTGRVLLPIVRVPLNIVAETMQYASGLLIGNVRLAAALRRGVETLQPEEADLIARELKKGSIGPAVMLLGYFGANAIGGYYQPQPGKKRPSDKPKWGTIRAFGLEVPGYLLHNPLLELLQVGATVRHVADSKLRKKDAETQGLSQGAIAAAFGLLEETPFMREMAEIEKARNPYTRNKWVNEQGKSLLIPSVVSKIAEWTDPEEKRDPKTFVDTLKTGIPGLREQVPAK